MTRAQFRRVFLCELATLLPSNAAEDGGVPVIEGRLLANSDGDLEAFVTLIVRGFAGQEQSVDFLIDTGFSGEISLSKTIITALNLAIKDFALVTLVTLANGAEYEAETYTGIIVWNGIDRLVGVLGDNEETSFIGMGLLKNHDMQMRVTDKGEVQITPVPKTETNQQT